MEVELLYCNLCRVNNSTPSAAKATEEKVVKICDKQEKFESSSDVEITNGCETRHSLCQILGDHPDRQLTAEP